MTKTIVKVEDIRFSYQNRLILDSVSLELYEQEFVALIGPNGGGKTTFLKLLMGILEPDSGSISIFGHPPKLGRSQIGYLAQNIHSDIQFPISVIDVVLMSRLQFKWRGWATASDKQEAESILDRLGVAHLKDRLMSDLSGGERQRVYLARALLNKPKLLILDEPLTGVDTPFEQNFYELLQSLKSEMAILMVSHDLSVVSVYVEKIGCLNKKLVYHDSKELSESDLAETYQCHVDLIAHGIPHRVFKRHD